MMQSDMLEKVGSNSRNPFSDYFKLFIAGKKTLHDIEYSCKRTSIVNMEKWFKPIEKEESNIMYLQNDIVRNESDVWWLRLCRSYCQNEKEKEALAILLEKYLSCIEKQKTWVHNLLPLKKKRKNAFI